jgi:hypothetical protein
MYASSTAIARTWKITFSHHLKAGRPVKAPQQLERLTGRHFISRIKTNGNKGNLARLCKVCNEAERNNADLSAQKRKRLLTD